MKKRHLLLLLPAIFSLFTACQKEVSVELNGSISSGSLQADAGGECLPKTVQGIYETGKVLDPSVNFIDVQVNATAVGTYRIYSDTVNGIFFQSTGSIATVGLNTIRLPGSGMPVNAGPQIFTIHYGSSSCAVAVSVQAPGGTVSAEFTLNGAPDACQTPIIAGQYIAGQALTPANTIILSVNVTVAGTYTISSALSNGMTFTGSGTFPNTGGPQNVTLTGTGTPVVASNTNIPVTAGSSTCTFTIDVTSTQLSDYFPLTAGSNWSYQFDGDANDSLLIRAKPGTVNQGGQDYTVFEGTVDEANDGFQDFTHYRKSGNDYYNYLDIAFFFGFDDPQFVELVFLKDNVDVGGGWQTTGYTGTVTDSSGTYSFTLRISYTIAQKDVAVTVAGVSYPNTIVVNEKYELLNGSNWVDATPIIGYYKSYYSKGIGLIKQDYYYEDGNPNPTTVILSQDLRRHQVL
jgi:hypothetical protein